MFITIINDCKSQNDIGRLTTRYSLLFPNSSVNFVGIDSNLGINSTLEAAGNLIDVFDASEGSLGIIAINVAPRGQLIEDGKNGSKFCFFNYKNTLVVSTIKGYNLSLVKKLKLVECVNIVEVEQVTEYAKTKGLINGKSAEYINKTQFRSFDFQPRICRWIFDRLTIPSQKTAIGSFPDCPNSIWHIDAFGNAKTTITSVEIENSSSRPDLVSRRSRKKILNQVQNDKVIRTNLGAFKFYDRLNLVPDGETAMYIGSSGINNVRFLEIATQNRSDSAAKTLGLKVGDPINIL